MAGFDCKGLLQLVQLQVENLALDIENLGADDKAKVLNDIYGKFFKDIPENEFRGKNSMEEEMVLKVSKSVLAEEIDVIKSKVSERLKNADKVINNLKLEVKKRTNEINELSYSGKIMNERNKKLTEKFKTIELSQTELKSAIKVKMQNVIIMKVRQHLHERTKDLEAAIEEVQSLKKRKAFTFSLPEKVYEEASDRTVDPAGASFISDNSTKSSDREKVKDEKMETSEDFYQKKPDSNEEAGNLCDECGNSFYSKSMLEKHTEFFHDIFTKRNKNLFHEESADIDKEKSGIKCQICDFIPSRVWPMKRHMRIKHAKNIYSTLKNKELQESKNNVHSVERLSCRNLKRKCT